MPQVRGLSEQHLNRALLARQMLLERAPVSVPRALERMGTLQNQYAPSGYVGLWSRVAGFQRGHLTRALERRQVVQGTLMRATIHLVSRRDYWPLQRAVEEPLLEWWFRTTKRHDDREQLRAIDRRARKLLSASPLRRSEIVRTLGLDAADWAGVALWTAAVRVPPSGTWEQRRADLYANAADWIGPGDVAAGRRPRPSGPAIPRRIRTCLPRRHRELHRLAKQDARTGVGPAAASAVHRRVGRRAARRAGRTPARFRRAGARSVPAVVGRHAARARATHGDRARGVPAAASSTSRRRTRSGPCSSTDACAQRGSSTARPSDGNRWSRCRAP